MDDTNRFVGIGIGIASILAIGGVFGSLYYRNNVHDYVVEKYIPPTCTSEGVRVSTCRICGKTIADNQVPMLDHQYTEWETIIPAKLLEGGYKQRSCQTCGKTEEKLLFPTAPFPGFAVNGYAEEISTENSQGFYCSYYQDDEEDNFSAYLQYLEQPESDTTPHDYSVTFVTTDGMPRGRFAGAKRVILRYDHTDYLHVRARVAQELWRKIAQQQNASAYLSLTTLPNGEPIYGMQSLLYLNGKFNELRTIDLPYHIFSDMTGVVRYAVQNGAPLVGGEEAKAAFETVLASIDAESGVHTGDFTGHFDVELLETYYAFCDVIGYPGGLDDDVVWASADGLIWYPVPVYPEESFGLYDHSLELSAPDVNVTAGQKGKTAAFWNAFSHFYAEAVAQKRAELVGTVLDPEEVGAALEEAYGRIEGELIESEREYSLYESHVQDDPIERIMEWYRERVR